MSVAKIQWKPIVDIVADVVTGKVPAVDNVQSSLKAIAEHNPTYNALIATTDDRALERAAEIDKQIAAGEDVGPLAGVPFIAKDNMLAFGAETTAASNMLKGFKAPYQATCIQRLEDAGAILVGKANMDAFAHGGSTENSDFGPAKNPHDIDRVPGGSSGGSAASAALGLAPFTLGTDTGGSIRQPASFCGVVGYKPTYGLISRSGVVAMASSTDVIGPFASRVEDAAIVLEVMAGDGPDPLDGTAIARDTTPYTQLESGVEGKKIGLVTEFFGDGLDPQVKDRILKAKTQLHELDATVEEVSIPSLPLALAIYYVVVPAELSSNLSRHDGQRYQFSADRDGDLEASYVQSRSQGFGAEAKRRIMIGTHVLSSGYYDAYYNKAQTVRTKLIKEFEKAFDQVDFLIGPVAPSTAFKFGEMSDPLQMYLQDIYSVAANLVGTPSISVPLEVGDGLPVGLQIIAPQQNDRALLSVAKTFQDATASGGVA